MANKSKQQQIEDLQEELTKEQNKNIEIEKFLKELQSIILSEWDNQLQLIEIINDFNLKYDLLRKIKNINYKSDYYFNKFINLEKSFKHIFWKLYWKKD